MIQHKHLYRYLEDSTHWQYYEDWIYRAHICGYTYVSEAIIELYDMFRSTNIVGKLLGVTDKPIRSRLKKWGIVMEGKGGRPDPKPFPEPTQIKALWDEGHTYKEIMDILGIGQASAYKYRRG